MTAVLDRLGDGAAGVEVTLLDNHDSFTWNLAHAFAELGAVVTVVDCDAVTAEDVLALNAGLVCVGPGPRGPAELPRLVELLLAGLLGRVPTLGVCLGMQAMVRATGGSVCRAARALHGETCEVQHQGEGLFETLPSPLTVMRYHSLLGDQIPAAWVITAVDADDQPMAIAHAETAAWGVQFHPESIGTEGGLVLLGNALRLVGGAPNIRHRPGSIPPPRSL